MHIEQLNLMTINVHIDIAPTRTRAGISLICDYLINCNVCDVTLGRRDLRNVTTCDKDGGGVNKIMKLV